MTNLLGAILLTAAVVLFILYPLLRGKSAAVGPDEEEPTEAEARSRVRLLALRDVEYEYHAGKLDESDYQTLRQQISREALDALREAESAGGVPEGSQARLEAEIAAARAALREGRACSACGHANQPGSRFCAHCGEALGAAAPRPARPGQPSR